MNPDRNGSGMTVNTLMLMGLGFSAGIPVVLIAFFGYFVSRQLQSSDATTFALWVFAYAIATLIGVRLKIVFLHMLMFVVIMQAEIEPYVHQ